MYVIGCDVSKQTVDVALVDALGNVVWQDKLSNEVAALTVFFLSLAGHYGGQDLKTSVESTGCYHFAVCEAAFTAGVPCVVYNPLITRQQIKATVRGAKTDSKDAVMIARLGLRDDVGQLYQPEAYPKPKYYLRTYNRLGPVGTAVRSYERHLREVLGGAPLPDMIEISFRELQVSLRTLRDCLREAAVAAAPPELMKLLRTIPGVGPYVAATLIAELQSVARFKTPKQLIAFVGLDPRIRQSGSSLNRVGRLSKRGSPHLRLALFLAANSARRFDSCFKTLYERKRAEGKSYTEANVVVARKLLSTIRAVWLRGTPYVVDETTGA